MARMTLETPGDRAFYALCHASVETLAALFVDLTRRRGEVGLDPNKLHQAMSEVNAVGSATYGDDTFTAGVAKRQGRKPAPQAGRTLSQIAAEEGLPSEGEMVELHDLIRALSVLFAETHTDRLTVPYIVKVLSKRLALKQKEVGRRLADIRPLTLDLFYYEFVSMGVLRRDNHTKLNHYFQVDGAWCAAIRKLQEPS